MNSLILHYHLQPFEMLGLLRFAIFLHYPVSSQFSFIKLIAIHLFLMVLCILWNRGQTFSFCKWTQSSNRAQEYTDVNGFRLLSASGIQNQEMSAFFFFSWRITVIILPFFFIVNRISWKLTVYHFNESLMLLACIYYLYSSWLS